MKITDYNMLYRCIIVKANYVIQKSEYLAYFFRFLFFFVWSAAYCQQDSSNTVYDRLTYNEDKLLEKYLNSSDSLEFKIGELVELAKADDDKNEFSAAIKKYQLALVLEQSVKKPGKEVFMLNYRYGLFIADNNPQLATEYLTKAIRIGLGINDVPLGDLFYLMNMKAGVHIVLNETDSALSSYRLAMMPAQKLGKVSVASIQNNIGYYYLTLGKLDSANIYCNEALRIMESIVPDSVLYCSIKDNLAQIGEAKGDFKNAIPIFRFNDSVYRELKRINRYVVNKVRLMDALQHVGSKEPGNTIPTLNSFIDSNKPKVQVPEIIKFYLFASHYYLNHGQSQQALEFMEKYLTLKDSLEQQNKLKNNLLGNTLLNAEKTKFKNELTVYKLNADKKELELKAIKQSLFYNKLIATISIIAGSGIIILLFLVYRNYKKQRDTNKQLIATQQALIGQEKLASLGQMTAGIAHEIQNPLNFVNNFSELSRENLLEIKNAQTDQERIDLVNNLESNLEKIIRHGKRADAIVRNMLEHSRTSKGTLQKTDINHLCKEYLNFAYKSTKSNYPDFDCMIERNFDEHLPEISVLPMDISKVLLNLMNNALFALRNANSPRLKITTTLAGNYIEIKIWDNAGGIKDSIKQKIFDPFFTTKPAGQGTGLGLSLSYNIIKAHDGELKLNSRENEFTEFIISLPVK